MARWPYGAEGHISLASLEGGHRDETRPGGQAGSRPRSWAHHRVGIHQPTTCRVYLNQRRQVGRRVTPQEILVCGRSWLPAHQSILQTGRLQAGPDSFQASRSLRMSPPGSMIQEALVGHHQDRHLASVSLVVGRHRWVPSGRTPRLLPPGGARSLSPSLFDPSPSDPTEPPVESSPPEVVPGSVTARGARTRRLDRSLRYPADRAQTRRQSSRRRTC